SNQAQQEVDEARERLRQLAARQQQENERMQRMADELRDRLGREAGSGGGGGAQRDLAQQAEEEARRLERLSRERQSPELADAARQMQQAADAMRRAASGNSQQGQAALDRLQRAAQGMDNARSSGIQQEIRDLEQRARELAQRQDEIQSGVEGLQNSSGTDRNERLRRLDERKDALAGAVDGLQSDAERLARDARREQPSAASGLEGAASEIRDSRLRDRITYSKGVARSGSPEYVREFENQISDYLDSVAERLERAAGAVGESAERQQERSLERARDLVRGLESLRERSAQQRDSGAAGQRGSWGSTAAGQRGSRGSRAAGQRGSKGSKASRDSRDNRVKVRGRGNKDSRDSRDRVVVVPAIVTGSPPDPQRRAPMPEATPGSWRASSGSAGRPPRSCAMTCVARGSRRRSWIA
ncbi:MAG: hypothetical protein KJZ47_08035, partial [Gemmatimonadales bacterium]|nr:hypothetical protein [Gemmatimonadales bacterium]